jgi:NADH-quinone oxidoreductase subunit L
MTWPLVILAFFSIFAGWLGFPHSLGGSNRFEKFLEPVFAHAAPVLEAEKPTQLAEGAKEATHTDPWEYILMFLSIGAAVVGWGFARSLYIKSGPGYVEPMEAKAPPVYATLLNKYYVDEGYDYIFTGRRKVGDVRLGTMGLGEASSWFDANVIDGSVNATGWMTRLSASISKWFDTWVIDGVGVNGPAIVARMLSYPARLLQWGLVQWYALVMVAGLLGFVFYYYAAAR